MPKIRKLQIRRIFPTFPPKIQLLGLAVNIYIPTDRMENADLHCSSSPHLGIRIQHITSTHTGTSQLGGTGNGLERRATRVPNLLHVPDREGV